MTMHSKKVSCEDFAACFYLDVQLCVDKAVFSMMIYIKFYILLSDSGEPSLRLQHCSVQFDQLINLTKFATIRNFFSYHSDLNSDVILQYSLRLIASSKSYRISQLSKSALCLG